MFELCVVYNNLVWLISSWLRLFWFMDSIIILIVTNPCKQFVVFIYTPNWGVGSLTLGWCITNMHTYRKPLTAAS